MLGSTGSIGTQALDVIAANPDRFEVVGLAAGGGNPGPAGPAARRDRCDQRRRRRRRSGRSGSATSPTRAPTRSTRLVENTEADVVLNALVGALGLQPTLAALASPAPGWRWPTRSR